MEFGCSAGGTDGECEFLATAFALEHGISLKDGLLFLKDGFSSTLAGDDLIGMLTSHALDVTSHSIVVFILEVKLQAVWVGTSEIVHPIRTCLAAYFLTEIWLG